MQTLLNFYTTHFFEHLSISMFIKYSIIFNLHASKLVWDDWNTSSCLLQRTHDVGYNLNINYWSMHPNRHLTEKVNKGYITLQSNKFAHWVKNSTYVWRLWVCFNYTAIFKLYAYRFVLNCRQTLCYNPQHKSPKSFTIGIEMYMYYNWRQAIRTFDQYSQHHESLTNLTCELKRVLLSFLL
jgi:hypothetical protein